MVETHNQWKSNKKIICGLLNGASISDLEWPWWSLQLYETF